MWHACQSGKRAVLDIVRSGGYDDSEEGVRGTMRENKYWQFASLLKDLREERQLTKTEVASRADLNPCHITRLESGARRPSRETVRKLASALGLGPSAMDKLLLAAEHAPVDVDRLLARQREGDRAWQR